MSKETLIKLHEKSRKIIDGKPTYSAEVVGDSNAQVLSTNHLDFRQFVRVEGVSDPSTFTFEVDGEDVEFVQYAQIVPGIIEFMFTIPPVSNQEPDWEDLETAEKNRLKIKPAQEGLDWKARGKNIKEEDAAADEEIQRALEADETKEHAVGATDDFVLLRSAHIDGSLVFTVDSKDPITKEPNCLIELDNTHLEPDYIDISDHTLTFGTSNLQEGQRITVLINDKPIGMMTVKAA